MKKALKIFIGVFVCLALFMTLIGAIILESQPNVIVSAHQQVDDADTVNQLLTQLKQVTRRRFVEQNVTFTKPQVNSLLGFMQRAIPEFSGHFDSDLKRASIQFSYHVPLIKRYINLNAELVSAEGISLENVSLGNIPVSGNLALWLMSAVVNQHTNSHIGDEALSLVKVVRTEPEGITIVLYPIHNFLMRLNEIQNGLAGADDEELRLRVTHYLAYLSELKIPQHRPGLSLADFLKPLFEHAQNRNVLSTPVQENEAALLALAVYTGHHRMANFIGDVQPYEGRVSAPRYRPMLAGRSDLTQHFVISAAIKILSEQGISTAIGEFKELMDRAPGGSGFSFADLAADLAGIELALVAIDPRYAEQVQMMLAKTNDESVFFPSIDDLPEGLSKDEFAQQFDTVESDAYLKKLSEIYQRLNRLPIVKLKQ
ncbi:hypothetical protein [Aliiglaciecola sp. M165]|uniref:hypothetical protein n=1 Tax=Aliiglaciecola sp. M165 TaxID=2593649 RepID=UPI00117E9498|nr:hypothetical protein [Aliiglaciecola sp. M165]TRY32909.1 hypothetical protein FM019_02665 [Aliiglaciecola sp. M165]